MFSREVWDVQLGEERSGTRGEARACADFMLRTPRNVTVPV